MPIHVQEDSWEQTASLILIRLPLKNVSRKLVDVFGSPEYIKVSYSPFLYEAYLAGVIDDLSSSIEITDNQIILKLTKSSSETWPVLTHTSAEDKTVMRIVRQKALDYSLQRARAELEKRKRTALERHKFAVNEHVDAEASKARESRDRMDRVKAETLASFDFSSALPKTSNPSLDPYGEPVAIPSDDGAFSELLAKIAAVDRKKSESNEKKSGTVSDANKSASIVQSNNAQTAAVRQGGTILFTATPRSFPTPQRESQVAEEEAWLLRQADYRKVLKEDPCDVPPEQRDPVWLKTKADWFLDAGDHDSAIACYSRALRLTASASPELYMNRSLAHLHKKNLHKVLEDTSNAIDLFSGDTNRCAQSIIRKERVKAHWRRGVAFFTLDLPVESLVEYEAALKISDGENEELSEQRDWVKTAVEGTASMEEMIVSPDNFSRMICGTMLEKS